MNNTHLWVVLLFLVAASFLFVFQHSTDPSQQSQQSSSLAGARLRARERTLNGHGHDHGHDWDDLNDDNGKGKGKNNIPAVVTSPLAQLWDDENIHVGAADGYRPPRKGTLASKLANRRHQYWQKANHQNGEPATHSVDDFESESPVPSSSSSQSLTSEEPSSSSPPLFEASEESSDDVSGDTVLPPLSDFQLGTRVWPLPSQVDWPSDNNGGVALLGANVKLITNIGDEVINALFPFIFTSTDCKLRPTIKVMKAISDTPPPMVDDEKDYPNGDNEEYELIVDVKGIEIKAVTQWGIINAFKTLAQLIHWKDQCAFIPNVPVRVTDTALLSFRGFMVDSPRVFLGVQQVRAVIDRMSIMKLNVLHLRLTDDQSFVIESKRHPGLNKGQPHNNMYSHDDIKKLIAYARARGVRIVPEIDLPGHATSWGKGEYPKLVAKCPSLHWGLPLDPTIELTWTVLRDVLEEMMELFIDPFFHLGGDEVNKECFEQDRELMDRARSKGLNNGAAILESFTSRFHEMLKTHEAFKKRTIIIWEDLYENHKTNMDLFRKDIVFHTWLSTKNGEEVAAFGHRSIRSTYLYYNEIHDGRPYEFYKVFKEMYSTDWYRLNFFAKTWQWKSETKHLFTGATSCMWEHGYSSYEAKVWPLMPAAAERLWSAPSPNKEYDMDAVHIRLKFFQAYVDGLQLDKRHATSGGSPTPVEDFNALRAAAGAKQGARDS